MAKTAKKEAAQAVEQAIRIVNVSKLNDDKLRETLKKAGVTIPKDADRTTLIGLASQEGLWSYKGNIVPQTYKQRYGAAQRCGDELSDALNAATRDEAGNVDINALRKLQRDNGISPDRWMHLNMGQQVMNTSNVLRGKVRRAEYVVVGELKFNEA